MKQDAAKHTATTLQDIRRQPSGGRCQRQQPKRAPAGAPSALPLVLMLLVSLLGCDARAAKPVQAEERLIGWKGESYREQPRPKFTTLSWTPRIFHAQALLTPEEVKHIIAKAAPRIVRSGVVDTETGGSSISEIRTSSGMFFERAEDPVIARIEARVADWLMVPSFNGEGIQVLKYEDGQKYDPHFDYFFHEGGTDNGGNRLVTVLMYLSDVEEGGETVFPNVKVPPHQTADRYSACAMKGLAVKPAAGSAVAFWSLQTDGRLDSGALHGGCPVLKGTKWSATKWVHVARYAMAGERAVKVQHVIHVPPPPPAPPGCADLDSHCAQWADSGECSGNPSFMLGSAQRPGSCLFACGRCDLGPNVPLDSARSPTAPADDTDASLRRAH